jgi:hypothetical protein
MEIRFLVIAGGLLCLMALSQKGIQANETSHVKIRIKFGDEVLTATMLDTETSRDFVAMLPLKLRLSDYAGAEKISDLPRELSTKHAPAGYDPSVGDIAFYSPWGNVAVFYKDAGYAKGLIHLGRIDGGIEKLANKKGDFDVLIETID